MKPFRFVGRLIGLMARSIHHSPQMSSAENVPGKGRTVFSRLTAFRLLSYYTLQVSCQGVLLFRVALLALMVASLAGCSGVQQQTRTQTNDSKIVEEDVTDRTPSREGVEPGSQGSPAWGDQPALQTETPPAVVDPSGKAPRRFRRGPDGRWESSFEAGSDRNR